MKNITRIAQLLVIILAFVIGALGHTQQAIIILLMGIYAKIIDK
jgi:uncharacterized membrane protein YuzA (DUF378 family)